MEMLCNNNLFKVATDESLNLPPYIRTQAFNRRSWYPEGLVLEVGKGKSKETKDGEVSAPVCHGLGKHFLGRKTIADVSEAIIGAALVAAKAEPNKFDLAVGAVTRLVKSKDHMIDSWGEIATLYKAPSWQTNTEDPIAIDMADKVKEKMGYQFAYPRLLRSAFTHPSDQRSTVPDYQRLEFLGDAVLDMVSINWLFNKFEDRNPQWLTEHKMAMVSNKFLAAVAVMLDFDKLITASTSLVVQISKYAQAVRDVLDAGKDNVKRDFWTEINDPPKALSDLVESYLGAVIVDSGFNYAEAESFFDKHILWFFEDISIYDSFANKHPTTFLQKRLAREYGCVHWEVLCSEPPPGPVEVRVTAGVVIHQKVSVRAESNSVRYAKVRASKLCLDLLDGMSIKEFRDKFECDCSPDDDGMDGQ